MEAQAVLPSLFCLGDKLPERETSKKFGKWRAKPKDLDLFSDYMAEAHMTMVENKRAKKAEQTPLHQILAPRRNEASKMIAIRTRTRKTISMRTRRRTARRKHSSEHKMRHENKKDKKSKNKTKKDKRSKSFTSDGPSTRRKTAAANTTKVPPPVRQLMSMKTISENE